MSRLRRIRQLREQRITDVLFRRWQRRQYVARFCEWFLMQYRGYRLADRVDNDCDVAVLGLWRWARQDVSSASPFAYIRAELMRVRRAA